MGCRLHLIIKRVVPFFLGVFLPHLGHATTQTQTQQGIAYPANDWNWQNADKAAKDICEEVRHAQQDPSELPSAQDKASLAKCDAEEFYYGFTQPADYRKARFCAFVTNNLGILAMIYANGHGVKRKLDLGIHYACLAGGAPAEINGRMAHLERLRKSPTEGEAFSICDDRTSGFMAGYCSSIEERTRDGQRRREWQTLTAAWSAADQKAFEAMRRVFAVFVETRIRNEVDLSGTGRAMYMIEEEAKQKERLLKSFHEFSQGKFPAYPANAWRTSDDALNDVYKRLQASAKQTMAGMTLTKDKIKATQRSWLKYRDAWVAFAAQKYPQVAADTWRTWLTNQRLEELREMVGYFGEST